MSTDGFIADAARVRGEIDDERVRLEAVRSRLPAGLHCRDCNLFLACLEKGLVRGGQSFCVYSTNQFVPRVAG